MRPTLAAGFLCCLAAITLASAQEPQAPVAPSPAQVLQATGNDDWRRLDPDNTVYFELPGGRVVLELAPQFAPRHVDNIRALVRAGHFDGGGVVRSQDNYVAQWATRPVPEGAPVPPLIATPLTAEFEAASLGATFTPLPDADVYAPETGFVAGFPVARDPETDRMWLVHCYGVVGVARGNDPDSGSGTQLFAVTGHAPRHLDRNASMVGRVVAGMEHLSTLPRGTGNLGFYESTEQVAPIRSAAVAADLPPAQRTELEILRTDSPVFHDYLMARRTRVEEWFVHKAGRIDVCNVGVPTRTLTAEE